MPSPAPSSASSACASAAGRRDGSAHPTALAQGNHALRAGDLTQAIRHYALGLVDEPSHGNGHIAAQLAADLVHLSKPRLPSLLFGLLYRLLWDARLLLDCDDDELAFVGAAHARPLADWLQAHGSPPTLADLPGRRWSELAMSLAPAFDTPGAGLTVANRALQQRHGGVIVRHARDPRHDQPSGETAAARRMTAI